MFLHTYNQSRYHLCDMCRQIDRSTRSRLDLAEHTRCLASNDDMKKFVFRILTIEVPEVELSRGLFEFPESDVQQTLTVPPVCLH